VRIMCVVAILGQLCGMELRDEVCMGMEKKIILSAITQQYMELLEGDNGNILERTQILKRLASMSLHINPSYEQCQYILRKFTTQLYFIHNNHSLVIPHTPPILTTHLQ
jgi:hypothetical protein